MAFNFTKPATPGATPAFGAAATGAGAAAPAFTFGAPALQPATSASTPAFGAPASTAQQGFPTFGASAAPTPQSIATTAAAAPSGFAFGTPAITSAPAFGATTAATSAPSLAFGGLTAGASSAFGTLTTAPAAGVQQGTTAAPAAAVTMKSKVSTLPPDFQAQVAAIADIVKKQTTISDNLSKSDTGIYLVALMSDIERVRKLHGSVSLLLEQDMASIQALRSSVREELNHVDLASRLIGDEKGNQPMLRASRHTSTVPFLNEKCEQFCRSALHCSQRLAELEDHIRSLVHSQPPTPQAVAETARAQNNAIVLYTSRVAELHSMVDKLREQYLVYRRDYFGDVQMP